MKSLLLKIKFKAIAMTLVAFLAPLQGLAIILIAVILVDTIFAIYQTIKMNGVASFKSNILKIQTFRKLFFYLSTMLLAYLVDLYIMDGVAFGIKLFFAKCITSFWVYVEVKSIDETSILLGNRSFWIIFKEMIKRLAKVKEDIVNLTGLNEKDIKDKV